MRKIKKRTFGPKICTDSQWRAQSRDDEDENIERRPKSREVHFP